jgi:hypothetical protein
MRKLVVAMAAAGGLVFAAALTTPALALPVNSLGALNAAAATLDNVEEAALVCGRYHCWHVRRHHRHHRHHWRWRRGYYY